MVVSPQKGRVGSAPRVLVSLVLLGCLGVGQARADEVIRVGMSAALSGPAQALGLGMKAGIEAYFASVNRAGGVHGRRLQLIDYYRETYRSKPEWQGI